AYVNRQVEAASVLDATQVEDLRAAGRHLHHLVVRDARDAAGRGHDARIGREDAVDVGVDLAHVGPERRRQRDRGGVGTTAAERGDVLGVLRDTLEARHDRDVALVDGLLDPTGRHVDDARLAVGRIGDHASLRAGERTRL